jgi:two-component system cell cycle response regulator
MSGRILVVDDMFPNIKLLEAKLKSQYFEVITAESGQEAIEKVEQTPPDIILLDVMMPGMNGFEVCEHLKKDPKTSHIPIVIVTALTETADRIKGLQAGADDFLSKPVNDTALFSRVRSLIRLKMLIDEWRIRENTAQQLGVSEGANVADVPYENGRLLLVNDASFETDKIKQILSTDNHDIDIVQSEQDAIERTTGEEYDCILVNINLQKEDGLRLCSYFRSNERTRYTPLIMISNNDDIERIAKGLEVGAHDYVVRPIDHNELTTRTRNQIRRVRYQQQLRINYEKSLNLALTDGLTGLFNRRYLMTHAEKMLANATRNGKKLCVLLFDLDHFKQVNDTYGHDVGDEVLKIFADRTTINTRSFDLVARIGGEEFVVILPDTTKDIAIRVAERLRTCIEKDPFKVLPDQGELSVTTSIGGCLIEPGSDETVESILKKADTALYQAKQKRNTVVFDGIGSVSEE